MASSFRVLLQSASEDAVIVVDGVWSWPHPCARRRPWAARKIWSVRGVAPEEEDEAAVLLLCCTVEGVGESHGPLWGGAGGALLGRRGHADDMLLVVVALRCQAGVVIMLLPDVVVGVSK